MSNSEGLYALKTVPKIGRNKKLSIRENAADLILEKEIGILAFKSRFLVRLMATFQSDVR